jgi:hypothetical protein
LFIFCRNGGRYPSCREISSKPFDGPASQVNMPPSEAVTIISPKIGVNH